MRPASCPARWRSIVTLFCLFASLLPAPAAIAARAPMSAAAPFTLTLSSSGGGNVTPSPAGPTYAAGTVVTLTPSPAAGKVLAQWMVDGAARGWANPLALTMDADHTVAATFAARPTFSDVPPGDAAYASVTELAARGVIKGYSAEECAARGLAAPCFGPDDPIVRAQVAALIVRSFGWAGENPGGPLPFSDLGGVDPELQRAIATLAARGIINGYGDTTFGPTDQVLHIQVVSFVTRALVQAGYWQAVTQDNPGIYANVPLASGHRLDLLTFVKYAGPIIDRPQGAAWGDWDTPASRSWTARGLWQALDSVFGGTGPGPSTSPSPGTSPSPSGSPSPSPVPGNGAPVAVADSYTTAEDTALMTPPPGVLGNDSDPDANPLTAVQVAGPTHGALTLNANGSFTYTPAADYNGPDSFTYQARDTGNALSAVTTVSITVTAVNDAPVNAVPGAQNATANTPLVFSATDGNALAIADVDAGTSPLQVTLTATNGTLTLGGGTGLTFGVGDGTADATTTFTGTLAAINAALEGLSYAPTSGYTGPATLQIATDDQGNTGAGGPLTDSDTIAITVLVGAAATIAKEAGDGGSATVGATRTVQVRVTDGTGVPVPGYTVSWAVATGGGALGAPTSATDASGIAAIDWTLGTTAGAQSVTATATGLVGSPLTFTATGTAGPAVKLGLTTQPSATVQSGVAFPQQPVAQVQDQYGNPVVQSGTVVTASILAGGGTLGGTLTATTDAGGAATFTDLALTGTVGERTLRFAASGLTAADAGTVTLTAGAAANIAVEAGAGQSATVGTATGIAPAVQVTDASGNPVAGVGVTFAVATGNGDVTGATPTTNAAGVAAVGSWTLGTTAGSNTLTATAPGLAGSPLTFTATGTPDVAARLGLTTQPSTTAQSGVALPQQPTVQVQDQYGNAVATPVAVTVTATIATGEGILGGTLTAITDAGGAATFTDLAITGTVGGRTLTFTATGLTAATSGAIAVGAGAASQLAVTTQPSATAQSGTAFAQQPTVQVQDASGNPVAQSGATVTAALATGGGTLTGTATAITDVAGAATFTDLGITGAAGERTLSFSASGLTGATSETIALTVGPPAQLAIGAQPSATAQAGIAFPRQPVIQLQDASGSPVAQAGITVTATIATGGGTLGGVATATTDASGAATFTDLALGGTIGNRTIAFSATGLTGVTSGTITLTPGTAAQLAFTAEPSSVAAGVAISPAVQVAIQDAYGNTVTTATPTVTVAIGTNPSSGTLAGTLSVSASGGVATFSNLSLDRVGTGYTLVASAGGLTADTSAAFNVTPGVLDHFRVSATGGATIGTQTAGTASAIEITAQDAFDNTVTSFTGVGNTVTITSTGTLAAGDGATAPFVNGVLASHSVTFGAGGTGITITATRTTGGAQAGTSNGFTVQAPPLAVDDGPASGTSVPGDAYHGAFNTAFTVDAGGGILANDTLGAPPATLTGFRVGATPYTTFGTPQGVAGGHTLTVNADGSLTFVPVTGFTGNFTFDYTIGNGTSSTATVTIAVGVRPTAIADTYTPVLVGNVPINTATSSQFAVMGNDLGSGLTPTLGTAANGTATINADGTFSFRPTAGFEGAAAFTYTVANGFGSSGPVTVSLTVGTPVWFINAGASAGGDGRYDAPFSALSSFAAINDGTGSNPAANDRIFLYTGAYSGGLTLLNGQHLIGQGATGSSFASVAGLTWPADAGTAPGINGTAPTLTSATTGITLGSGNTLRGFTLGNVTGTALSGTGFGTLVVAEVGINTTGRALSLTTGTLSGGFAQLRSTGGTNNVSLSGVATTGTATLGAAGDALAGATGDAFVVAGGTGSFAYAGNITQASNAALLDVSGGHSGTLTFTGTLAATNGTGLQFTNADGSYSFTGTTTLNGGNAGIDVANGSSGTFAFGAGTTITNPAAEALVVANSAPALTYSGAFTKTNIANSGITLSSNTGGTIAFDGTGTKTLSTGSATAVNISSNTGATISFTGGGLAITTTTGTGFNATGGGTVTVAGATNTIASAGGVALNVANTTIGAGGLTFRSLSANGGANGIVLDNTGATAGLTVTGNGGSCTVATPTCTGGHIQAPTGADGATGGNGIYLRHTLNPTFSLMRLSGSSNNGLYGTLVTGLTVDGLLADGLHGDNATQLESVIHLEDTGGTVKVLNSTLNGGAHDAFLIRNVSTAAPTLTLEVATVTVGLIQGSVTNVTGNTAIQVIVGNTPVNAGDPIPAGGGTIAANIHDNTLTHWWGNAINVIVRGNASGTAKITGNDANQTSGALAGAGGIWVAGGSLTYAITGNTVNGTNGTAISADRGRDGATMSGTIDGNTIGTSGVANSGTATGIGIFASHHGPGATTVKISNNTLRQINGSASGAITVLAGDTVGFGGSGTINATIVGNNIQESGTTVNNAQHGILITLGVQSGPPTDTDSGCYDILNNTITNFNSGSVAGSQNRIRVNQRFGTTSRWPGYTGATTGVTSVTDLAAYLLGRNTASNSTNANSSMGGFLNTSPAGSSCAQPQTIP